MAENMENTSALPVSLVNFTINSSTIYDSSGKVKAENILIMFIQTVLMISIIVGNALVIAAVIKFKNLRSVLYRLVASLALADMLVAFVIPVNIARFASPELNKNRHICLAVYGSSTVSFSASVLHLLGIAIDRSIALNNPLKYPSIMTGKSYKLIFVIWITSLAVGLVPAFGIHRWDENDKCTIQRALDYKYMFALCIVIITIGVAMLIMYIQIFCVARNYFNRTYIQNAKISKGTVKTMKKDAKAAKVLGTVLLTFLVCWMPFVSVIMVIYLGKVETATKEYKTVSYFLAVLNSCLNPIIYAWMSKGMRAAFKILLRCQKKQASLTMSDILNGAPMSLPDMPDEEGPSEV